LKITLEKLTQDLAAIVDPTLAKQIVTSYIEMIHRYHASDWKPSELDGGQFCEVIGRALYQVDSGTIPHRLLPGDIVNELRNRSISHNLSYEDRHHFCQVLQTTYKFRNNRGVAHISSTYNANHLDAMLVVANVKWMFAEFLLLVWSRDRSEVGATIESIIQLEHPLIYEVDGQPIVLSTQLNAAEEILVLLQHALNGSMTRSEIKQAIRKDQSTISKAINRLDDERKIYFSTAGDIRITPLGKKQVHEVIIPNLNSNNGKG